MRYHAIPGLHRRTGLWGYCSGVLKPVVVFDPLVDTVPGGNALMIHEATHAKQRHALVGIVIGALTLGLAYRWWRMHAEKEADKMALRLMGYMEFKRFCHMHPHPTTPYGKYLYCATPEARIVRAAGE